jgi:NAD(P)-dependent dehydrogenase (short-subunit alcohol dehydrogenase family)
LVAVSVVVVTGAAMGIGLATAARCLADGWRVVGVDVDESALARAADELGEAFAPVTGDVAERGTHERAAAEAERAETLTGWVNNAGIEISGRAHEIHGAPSSEPWPSISPAPHTGARSRRRASFAPEQRGRS